MTIINKYIFCQCMKPWSICISKNNSYKLDVRDLILVIRARSSHPLDP